MFGFLSNLFLNTSMMAWSALAGAPVVIHLLNRRRRRIVHWAAMQFLDESVAKSSRRMRLEQLLILLLRVLLIALLVFAMCRPFLPGALPLPSSRAKRNVVIILDRSLSMRYDEHRISTLARAKDAVAKIIDLLEDGDSVNVVAAGGKPQPVLPKPIIDCERIKRLLKDVEPSGDEANLPLAFEVALAQLDESHNPQHEIYVVTDRQSYGWHAESDGQWFAALAKLRRQSKPPKVYVLPVGAVQHENAAVVAVTPAYATIGIYQETRFDVRVTNFGKERREHLNVSFSVAEGEEQVVQVTIDGGESATVPFRHQFAEAGSYLVNVRIDADALPADDQMTIAVDVFDEIPVLLIDGAPERTALTSPGPLELALMPRDRDNPAFKTLLKVAACRPADIPDLATEDFHLVVMHDLPDTFLTTAKVSDIEHFVDDGGGLLIFPGPNTQPARYNSRLYRDATGPLPARIEPPDDQNGTPVHALAQAFTHPALIPFRNPRHGDFTLIEVHRHFKLAIDPADAYATVLAKLDNNSPLLVEKKLGQGKVILSAVPVDAEWTNLQKRSFFVPLIHYIAYYLAGSVHPPRNVPLGSPISHVLPPRATDKLLDVVDPDGNEEQLEALMKGKRLVATFSATRKPGVYRMTEPNAARTTFYVVQSPAQESDLTDINPREKLWIETELGASFCENWDDLYAKVFAEGKHRREMWQLFVLLALGIILLETFLTGRFAKRSQQG